MLQTKVFVQSIRLLFSGDSSELAAGDVLAFVREAIQRLPHMRQTILTHMMEAFPTVAINFISNEIQNCPSFFFFFRYEASKSSVQVCGF